MTRTAAPPAPPNARPLALGDAPSLSRVTGASRRLPNRVMLYGMEGWGKTSFAAQAPAPIFLMTRGEDGLETLIEHGQLPDTPHFANQARTFGDVLAAVNDLIVHDHGYRTFVVDTLNGVERLCFEQVCSQKFNGNAVEFDRWAQGQKAAVEPWIELLGRLDRLREAKNMSILLLAHSSVEPFKNPEGPDFDRYQPSLDRKYLWPVTAKWLDMILFGCFQQFSEKEKGASRGKGSGGQDRLIYTERHAAYDAKHRHGLPGVIECGESASTAWNNFAAALKAGRNKNTVAQPEGENS